jgi:hypothetical protein
MLHIFLVLLIHATSPIHLIIMIVLPLLLLPPPPPPPPPIHVNKNYDAPSNAISLSFCHFLPLRSKYSLSLLPSCSPVHSIYILPFHFITIPQYTVSQGSMVGFITSLWIGRPRNRGSIPVGTEASSLLQIVQTGSVGHAASYPIGT